MNSRVLLALALVLLLGGAALYGILGQRPRGTGPDASLVESEPARSEAPTDAPAPAPAVQPPPPEAERVAEPAASAATAGTWTVRVLRAGAPAAGVEVVWATPEAMNALPDEEPGANDPIERVRKAGVRGRTDSRGEIVLAPLPVRSRIAAFEGASLASHFVRGDEASPIVLELTLDRTLAVKVVDARGAPRPGLPVLLNVMEGRSSERWNETTRGDGLATFRHVGVTRDPPLGPTAAGTVSVVGPLLDPPVALPVSVADWPESALVLVMPDWGSIVVEVVDEEGRPRTDLDQDVVALMVEREQVLGAELYDHLIECKGLEDGRARFELVGLDLGLCASFLGSPSFARADTTFRGPARMGEEVVARLALATPTSSIAFRVVDERGQPFVNAVVGVEVQTLIRGNSMPSQELDYTTDAEGRAQVPLLEPWHEGSRVELVLTHAPRLTATLDLSREFPPGVTDLGDVVLGAPSVLAAGRVVDPEGKPVSAAQVQLQTQREDLPPGRWLWLVQTPSQEDGTFSFQEDPKVGDLRVLVSARGFMEPEPVPVVHGARDILVVLERGGAVAGSLVTPEGLPPSMFELGQGSSHAVPAEEDGTFVVGGLAPGSVDLALWLGPGNALLRSFPGVAVIDGETTRDPRLQGIDCRDLMSALHVRVRTADGQAANGGWVRVIGAEGQEAAFLIENGTALVLGPPEPLDLEINVPEHRIARRFDVSADLDVLLEAAFRVRLELPPDVELPPEPNQLQVSLARVWGHDEVRPPQSLDLYRGPQRTGWWNRFFGGDGNTFGASREVFVSVQEPGAYEVQFFLVVASPSGAMMSSTVEAASRTPLQLDESSAGATFRVAPDAARLAEVLSR